VSLQDVEYSQVWSNSALLCESFLAAQQESQNVLDLGLSKEGLNLPRYFQKKPVKYPEIRKPEPLRNSLSALLCMWGDCFRYILPTLYQRTVVPRL
jgi:hypothetical protein